KLLYIGKAKVLKNRVKSYFNFTPTLQPSSQLSQRVQKMVSEIYDIQYIVVSTENDALILENSLIKQLKPKYNILLRDDKTYPYIFIDYNQEFPRLEITRKIIKSNNIRYYGPFSSGAKDLLDSIYEILPLVQKKSCIKGKKACIFYEIKRCLAPCEGKISKNEYDKIVQKAIYLLTNKQKVIEQLQTKMEEYSESFRFEDAMRLRDRIASISKSQIKSTLDFAKDEDFDLFMVELVEKKAIVIKMFIRAGKLISTSSDFLNITDISNIEDIYKTTIINYYSTPLPNIPSLILTPIILENKDELEYFISLKHNKKVIINTPKIGIKLKLIELARKNAQELLKINKLDNYSTIYTQIKELFNLENIPKRFEAYDNSHMMGQAKVASMIVWDNNKFYKDDYRVYNLEADDEYGQMRELLTRRVDSFESNPPPDLWVIDGGRTVLNLAYDIINSVGVNLEVIAIAKEKIDAKANRAKGKAKDIIYTKNNVFKLEPSDKRLHFIQRLRDEVHRSAITFHKKQKRKDDKKISLLSIKGIGEAKVKKLLNYFGSFEAIKQSDIKELEKVLNSKDANLISTHFKDL
ncbi:MAG: excinuclease ABC subunit UvrC, partial [Campylobacterota bacterium]|nr:excinuclease ABC subunit UvrC [Campylobacterota bacterium]